MPDAPDNPNGNLRLDTIEAEGLEAARQRAQAFISGLRGTDGTITAAQLRQLDRVTAGIVFRELAQRSRFPALENRGRQPPPPAPIPAADNRRPLQRNQPRVKRGWKNQRKWKAGYIQQAAYVGSLVGSTAFCIAVFTFRHLIR